MRREDEGKVDEAIEAALVEAEAEGFDPRRAEGILHQLELSLKHRTADFGLSWCSAVTGAWAMGCAASAGSPWKAHTRSVTRATPRPFPAGATSWTA